MRRKNDRIILGGIIAIGILAMACFVTVLGLGAYVYTNEDRPTPTLTPTPTAAPVITAIPAGEIRPNPLFIKNLLSDEGDRTYTLNIELMPGASPVDMSRVSAQIVADGLTYDAWDIRHGEHIWSSNWNKDAILDPEETFSMTIYAPQAGLPLKINSLVQIVLLLDGQEATSLYASAV